MQVVCVINDNSPLKLNEIYLVVGVANDDGEYLNLLDSDGNKFSGYASYRFKLLSEVRKNKLNKCK